MTAPKDSSSISYSARGVRLLLFSGAATISLGDVLLRSAYDHGAPVLSLLQARLACTGLIILLVRAAWRLPLANSRSAYQLAFGFPDLEIAVFGVLIFLSVGAEVFAIKYI